MTRRKLNALAILAMTAGVLLAGAALLAFQPPHPAKSESPRLDAYGDPLPPGAIARLGTERLRQGFMTYAAVFSPDGKTVASTSAGQGICLWEAATGKQIHRFEGHTDDVYSVAFARDGKKLASGGRDWPEGGSLGNPAAIRRHRRDAPVRGGAYPQKWRIGAHIADTRAEHVTNVAARRTKRGEHLL